AFRETIYSQLNSGTWFSLVSTVVFTFFKGHESFQKRGIPGFIAAYILIPWFIALTALWKYAKGDPIVPLERIDLIDGRREIDLEEENYHQWKNTREKVSLWDRIMARA
ncbi:6119_t:CDS:2, partial [Acaulospora colombiana]